MRANADNLVLLPQAVNELLKLERVDFIQIDKVLPGPIYHIRVIEFSEMCCKGRTRCGNR